MVNHGQKKGWSTWSEGRAGERPWTSTDVFGGHAGRGSAARRMRSGRRAGCASGGGRLRAGSSRARVTRPRSCAVTLAARWTLPEMGGPAGTDTPAVAAREDLHAAAWRRRRRGGCARWTPSGRRRPTGEPDRRTVPAEAGPPPRRRRRCGGGRDVTVGVARPVGSDSRYGSSAPGGRPPPAGRGPIARTDRRLLSGHPRCPPDRHRQVPRPRRHHHHHHQGAVPWPPPQTTSPS